jgi:CRP/FNR family nitrogen fixation transcriptional regulator
MTVAVLAFPPSTAQTAGAPPHAAVLTFSANEEIYAQGEETSFIYQVLEGAIRTARYDIEGRRQIGDFYHVGDFFGLESGPEHRFAAEALGACRIAVIRRSALAAGGDGARDLERIVWTATARELERTREHLVMLGRKTAREKVVSFLVDLAERQDGGLAAMPMGRQDIADYLGLTIETVSRMMTQLQAEGVIALKGYRRFRIVGGREAMSAAA